MARQKNDISNNPSVQKNPKQKSNAHEDEINLNDLFRIVSKRKYFIFFGTTFPVLLISLILFFRPNDYKITYTYDINQNETDYNALLSEFQNNENMDRLLAKLEYNELSEKNRKILLESFYSSENLDKLTATLSDNGFEEYGQEISKDKIQQEISGTLLSMIIIGKPQENIQRIYSIVRNNFETNLITCSVKQNLRDDISKLKAEIAEIEENKFILELELDSQKAILSELKNRASADQNSIQDGIVLHLDNANQNSVYLPWAHQVQATNAKIIYIEETIRTNQKRNNHYKTLIDLNKKLLDEIKNNISSYYTAQEFHSFMTDILSNYKDIQTNDYVNAYTEKLENIISAYSPLIEKPKIYPVPRGIVKKCFVFFAALLMITILGTFLLEAVQKNKSSAA